MNTATRGEVTRRNASSTDPSISVILEKGRGPAAQRWREGPRKPRWFPAIEVRGRLRVSMGAVHMVSRTAGSNVSDWFQWIAGDGTGAGADIDADNDGEMADTRALVDLSQALSQRLGRQMSMMSVYKVNYLRIELENVDDLNDNEDGVAFGGKVNFWSPTKHRMNAMKLARSAEKHAEKSEVDADSFYLSTDHDYSGIRFNWDADGQVHYATSEAYSGLAGTEWDLKELFDVYDGMVEPGVVQSNALWSNDGRTGFPENIGFGTSYWNNVGGAYQPQTTAFEWNGGNQHIEVLGGLLEVDVIHSSTDPPGAVDDDYRVRITVGITGWRDF